VQRWRRVELTSVPAREGNAVVGGAFGKSSYSRGDHEGRASTSKGRRRELVALLTEKGGGRCSVVVAM
jgi:hypothetical protein